MLKTRLMAAALAVSLLTFSACSAQTQTEYITEITVEQVVPAEVSYSQDSKTYAVTSLEDTLSAAIAAAYGDKASSISQKYEDYISQAVDCFESRGISEDALISIVDELAGEQDLLASLISNDMSDMYAAVQLFSIIAKTAGTDLACLVVYDISLIICDYHIDMYYNLYKTYGYPYQLSYAGEWEERKDGVQSVGEENYLNLLKIAVSALSVRAASADSVQGLLSGFSAGEGAMYLRAQGYMTAKLTLTADDWNFVLNALGDSGYSKKAKAVCSVGDSGIISQYLPQLVKGVASALIKADADCVQALMDGNYSAFLKRLLSSWTTDEWNNLAEMLSRLSGDYQTYFTKNALQDSYLQFTESVTEVSYDNLMDSAEEDFYQNLKGFIASYSAEFAYVIFGL